MAVVRKPAELPVDSSAESGTETTDDTICNDAIYNKEKRNKGKHNKGRYDKEKAVTSRHGRDKGKADAKASAGTSGLTVLYAGSQASGISGVVSSRSACSSSSARSDGGSAGRPDHALALSAVPDSSAFPSADVSYAQAVAYLRREAIVLPPDTPRGFVVVTYRGAALGFVKNVGNRANNLYPQEWKIKSTHVPDEPHVME